MSKIYQDELYCDNCEKYTMHDCHDSGHERDSSGDSAECLECHWKYSGLTGEYSAPSLRQQNNPIAEQPMSSLLLQFYNNELVHPSGKTIDEILAIGPDEFEECHDYVQWLFPTYEKSAYAKVAPLLDFNTRWEFVLPQSFCWNKFEQVFYFAMNQWGLRPNYEKNHLLIIDDVRNSIIISSPHNWLRITRILKCCKLFGRNDLATLLFTFCVQFYLKWRMHRGVCEAYDFWFNAIMN